MKYVTESLIHSQVVQLTWQLTQGAYSTALYYTEVIAQGALEGKKQQIDSLYAGTQGVLEKRELTITVT